MKNIGEEIQFSIYSTMHDPDPERLPIVLEEWQKLAREKLEDGPYYYVAGGAGSGQTMEDNLQAFKNYKIVQKMLNKVDERDLTVELFGKTYPYPLFQIERASCMERDI